MPHLPVALIQHAPVLFDLAGSLKKAKSLCREASKNGARLIVFPEAFLGSYPRGLSFGTRVGSRSEQGREDWLLYWQGCPTINGIQGMLGEWARQFKVYLGMGLVEKAVKGSSLYCSFIVFNPEGQLIHHHRKIKPTGTERLIWGEGDGNSLKTVQTEYGNMGSLICWENYMPLARMALYETGMDIHLAPTADSRDSWTSSMIHIALEGRCFVLSCNQFVTKEMYPSRFQEELTSEPDIMCRGGSMIVSPLGEILAGPVYGESTILHAELDLSLVPKSRLDFDVTGHYSRPDLFSFKTHTNAGQAIN